MKASMVFAEGMDFILLSLALVGFIVLVLVLLARAYPGSGADLVDWRPTRSYEDEAQLESDDVQQMIAAQNEMRRSGGSSTRPRARSTSAASRKAARSFAPRASDGEYRSPS